MKFRIIPRDESFFPLFSKAADNVLEGARKLNTMVYETGDNIEQMKVIKKVEKQGDTYTREIISKVQSSFVTPFDREDIHDLAEGIDDILDEILNVADLLVLHNVHEQNEHLPQLSLVLVKSCENVCSLMGKLSKLDKIEIDLDAINDHKRQARKIYRDSVSYLFSGELKSFDVLKLKDVNESLREAVKQTDRVADIVEGIALKHA